MTALRARDGLERQFLEGDLEHIAFLTKRYLTQMLPALRSVKAYSHWREGADKAAAEAHKLFSEYLIDGLCECVFMEDRTVREDTDFNLRAELEKAAAEVRGNA